MRNYINLILACSVGLAITAYFVVNTEPNTVFGAFQGSDGVWDEFGMFGATVYGFVFTLIGITLGVIYRHLISLRGKGQETVNVRTIVTYLATSIDYKIAMLGAPIAFGLIWRSIGETPIEIYTILALENGFVSNAVVAQLVSKSR